jgi:hypothetical protein
LIPSVRLLFNVNKFVDKLLKIFASSLFLLFDTMGDLEIIEFLIRSEDGTCPIKLRLISKKRWVID